MKIISTPSMPICAPDSSPAESKAISGDKSPSQPSIIPPAMLSSRCPVRISFRLAPVSPKLGRIYDSRYTVWDDEMHHDYTDHRYEYSWELDTRRVLISAGVYCVVHRLIRSSLEGQLVEISVHCPHDDPSHACNCIEDPSLKTAIQNSQSEVVDVEMGKILQRILEVERGVAESKRRTAVAEQRTVGAERRTAVAERRIAVAERRIAVAEQRIAVAEQRITGAKQRIAGAEQIIAGAERITAVAEQRIAVAERRIAVAERIIAGAEQSGSVLCNV